MKRKKPTGNSTVELESGEYHFTLTLSQFYDLQTVLWWYCWAKSVPEPVRKRAEKLIKTLRKQTCEY